VSLIIYDSFDTWDPSKWDIKRNGGGRVTISVVNGRLVFRDTSTEGAPAVAIIRSKQYFHLSKDRVQEVRVDVELPTPPAGFISHAAYFVITPSSITENWADDMYQIAFYTLSTGGWRVGVSAQKGGSTVFSCPAVTLNKNYGTLRYVVLNDEIAFYVDDTEICRDTYRLGSREVALWLETIMSGGCEVRWDNVAYIAPPPSEAPGGGLSQALQLVFQLLMVILPVILLVLLLTALIG